jgi:nitrite reductase/ring-hydroxylating ferredoxin subunit
MKMAVTFLKRNIFQRIFGIPATKMPQVPDCWSYSDGRLTIDLGKAPELENQGGALRCEGGNLPVRVLVVRGDESRFYAYRNRCTHLGHRRLDPVPGTDTVQCCSVNKSTFDLKGQNIHGPAPKPIDSFPVENQGDRLVVTIS